MVMWIVIITLLALGLVLLIAELIFIPGTTVVGLLGVIFMIAGVYVSYNHFGAQIGQYTLIATLALTLVTLFVSFRSNAWTRFALKETIDSKVNQGLTNNLNVGDEGITSSTLRPIGKAEFHNNIVEVKTLGYYVEQGCRVKITSIQVHQIIVEPITNHS